MNNKIIKRQKVLISVILIFAVIISSATFGSQAKTKTIKISASDVEAGKQFTFKNLQIQHTFQNFAYTPDGKYVLGTSISDSADGKGDTLISLCSRPSEPGPDAEAQLLDSLLLKKYGHSDVIEISQPKKSEEIYHVWVSNNPCKEGYGRDIVRLTMAVEDGKIVIKKKITINNFIKTNVINGKAAKYEWNPTLERVDVSIDKKNNQIVFRVGCYTCVNYVAYDFKKLNKALDKVGNNKKYNIAKAAKWQKANLRTNLVPCISIQSFQAIDNTIYVCGGYFNRGAGIYAIKYKVTANGKAVQEDKYEEKFIDRNIKIGVSDKANTEIEGMKIIRNSNGKLDVHVNFFKHGINIRNGLGVYKFEI